jgi:hypothetical protein
MADNPADNPTTQNTTVTRVTGKRGSGEVSLMSYTAVTSHRGMAEAFVNEMIRIGQKIMPDHELSVEDLMNICNIAVAKEERGVVMFEGRHLRGRVSEQISRANRYKEPFSLIVIKLNNAAAGSNTYDSVVDTLCERMRQTDLMFLFKSRLVLILPHTAGEACEMLTERIETLLEGTVNPQPPIEFGHLTYPNDDITQNSQVLDWVEDQLRTFT